MTARRKRGNASPTLKAFGRQLRRYREAKGLSQERVAGKANVTGAFVCMIETGKSRCTREFAAIMDRELEAGGALLDLWDDLVMDAAFPTWFNWPAVESEAVELVSFHVTVIHGLLQTVPYATTVLYGDKEAVDARMRRQAILTREIPPPPMFSLLLDESVLYRNVGGPEVMREQLEHLMGMVSSYFKVQIVPAQAHLGASGSFTIATLDDRSEVAYVESAARGLTMSEPDDLATLSRTLLELRSLALPVSQSMDLITRTAEQKWT